MLSVGRADGGKHPEAAFGGDKGRLIAYNPKITTIEATPVHIKCVRRVSGRSGNATTIAAS